MPSSSEVRARQPSSARRLTSSNLRGVPSGREGSKLILAGVADSGGDHAREFGDGDVFAGADIDQLGRRNSSSSDERRRRRDRRHRGIRAAACRCPRPRHLEAPDNLGLVKPADQRGDDVAVFGMIIVAGAVEIGRHHADEVGAVLAAIGLGQLDAGDLGDRIGLVGRLQRPGQQRILAQSAAARAWDRCRTSRETSASRRR